MATVLVLMCFHTEPTLIEDSLYYCCINGKSHNYCRPVMTDMFLKLIILLNFFKVDAFLSSLVSLDQSRGPRYRKECLPYFTVLYLGMSKSELRRLYGLALFTLKMFAREPFDALLYTLKYIFRN